MGGGGAGTGQYHSGGIGKEGRGKGVGRSGQALGKGPALVELPGAGAGVGPENGLWL